jgi:hypothetical protein
MPENPERKLEFRSFPLITILANSEGEAEQSLRRAQAALDGIEGVVTALDEECYREVDGDIDVPWEPDSREGGVARVR